MSNPLGLLGLARKAGRLVMGSTAVEQALRRGQPALLLLASDASANTARQAKRWAGDAKTQLLSLPHTKEQLGRALGRPTCALAVLTDE
jgi:ribosomal protein L7Ae-like RNA K-turn-binding protein